MANSDLGTLGIVGLGVMGASLARNAHEKGVRVVGYERSDELRAAFAKGEFGGEIELCADLASFVEALPRPRRVFLMVTAGAAVDSVIQSLHRLLEPGDAVADGGNSHFEDTERRAAVLGELGIHFVGTGVSGGQEGARRGPCMMPGGTREGWEVFRPVYEAIAARTPAGPCVAHMGPGGAGHFVKMVHNGIEYGAMQLLAEAYDCLRRVMDAEADECANTFARWNEGDLGSFLVEISAKILAKRDDDGEPLVQKVLGRAEQKGTGRWTVAAALDLGIPIPTIAAGLDARSLSSRLDLRRRIAARTRGVIPGGEYELDDHALHDALLLAHAVCYAQGLDLLRSASSEKGYDLDLARIATIWQGGCIIRAEMLKAVADAYTEQRDLEHLLEARAFDAMAATHHGALRRVVGSATQHGVAIPALSASLAYLDALRTEHLPTNLVQAQRDAFGSHGVVRIDDPEGRKVHLGWT
ncbi:MAG: NADP-dependent phosphogluconate dehydrogenase [Planctomycetota bacterium]